MSCAKLSLLSSLLLALSSAEARADEVEAPHKALLVVVHKDRPESDIPVDKLARIFRGEEKFWSNAERIYPVLPPEDTGVRRQRFLSSLLKLSQREFNLHWKELVFRGDVAEVPLSPPDERGALRTVFASRGGIALVDGGSVKNLSSVVKVLTVSGKSPESLDYPLKW
jgi:hypothetical protein